MRKITIVIVFFTIFINDVFSQNNEVFFEQITNESGRSLGFITGIAQDETGFMWFSTRKGLYRYNGYSYKLFKHQANDSLSLPFNDITFMYRDMTNKLWVRHYDQLSVFANEKRFEGYDTVLSQHFDIEAKVVQDKDGNYWIGPTGNGLIQYNPSKNILKTYNCPPQTYTEKAFGIIDSVVANKPSTASIADPQNNSDTTVSFKVQVAGYYLIYSTGEIDKYGKYDFGTLTKNGNSVWSISNDLSMWAGGEIKNRIEATIIKLDPGKYELNFKSDLSHCCNAWEGKMPDKIKHCGIYAIAVSNADAKTLQNAIQDKSHSASYIESNLIKDLLIDNLGQVWFLSENGLNKFNYTKQRFEHKPIDFDKIFGANMQNEFFKLFQDRKGIFWIGSSYGLISYDYIWGKYTLFQNSEGMEVLTSNTVYSLYEDKHGLIWIGTDKGINIYDRDRKTIEKVKANNRNRLFDDRIIKIFEDNSENIWIATFEGLNRLIKNQFKYTPLGIEADNGYPVHYDMSANIWYAHLNKIYKYSRTFDQIEHYVLPDKLFNRDEFTGGRDYIINDMTLTPDQQIWVAIDNKLSRFNLITKKIDATFSVNAIVVGNDSIKNSIKKIIPGKSGKIYGLCPNGILAINSVTLKKEQFYTFGNTYDFIEDVDLNFFKTALYDSRNRLWVRTGVGIYLFNPQLTTLSKILEFDESIKNGPTANGQMTVDKDGSLWISALPFVYRINGNNHKVDTWKCPIENDWGASNVFIGKTNIWVYGANGLFELNPENGEFTHYSVEDGLIDNNINGIEEDNLKNLWLTSLKGLNKFDTQEKTCQNFFTSSDMVIHRFLGNPTDLRPNNGEVLLFTTSGFVSFYPDSINLQKPKVVVDKFTIRGKEIALDSLIYYKKELVLPFKQNFLAFEFAVLDFTAPSQNKYAYMLEGLDETWIYADADNRRGNYSGISPGHYVFRVKGANNDKTWNNDGVAIRITITPPWYKTTFAYILYIIVVGTSIWLFVKIRERQLKEDKRILEEKVKQRTCEIEAQKEKLAKQKDEIEEAHKSITDSIQYARRIQAAILPPVEELKEVIDDYFILYRPRDIVSGDYYWATRKENLTIIIAADCTGHGVPGAFMSMLGIAFLNEIVNKEGVVEPNLILDRLREQIIKQLHQTGKDGESKDGMDVSLYVINHDNMKLTFAGAYNGLYYIRDGVIERLDADKMPIGYHIKKDIPFTLKELDLKKGDCLYNSSDGYPDQFGGEDGRKFMTKNFKELLVEIHRLPMAEQREILDKRIDEWRGSIDQIDDIIVIGVRI